MFTNLIESESHRGDFKRRGRFVLFTTAVYALLFVFAGVLSIYAYDAQLETQDQELVALLPPVAFAVPSHVTEPERPRNTRNNDRQLFDQRRDLVASVDRPDLKPNSISTTPFKGKIVREGVPTRKGNIDSDADIREIGTGPIGRGDLGGTGNIVRVPDNGETAPPPFKPTPVKPKLVHKRILNSQAVSLPEPPYPPLAKQIRLQGAVNVQVLLDETGKVISARSVAGHAMLAPAAVRAAYQARFTPTVLDGQPVKVSGVITYNFMLR